MTKIHSLLLLFLCLHSHSQALTKIPFTLERNCIYLYIKVNESDSLKFLLDTGADGSALNESALKKAPLHLDGQAQNTGSSGTNQVKTSSGNTITLGAIAKREATLSIIDFGSDDFDGIIGTDLMKGHILEIDYHTKTVNLYAPNDKSINFKGYSRNRLYVTKEYPTLIKSTLVIDGKKYSGFFGIDSGADDALTISAPYQKKNNLGARLPKIGQATATGSNGVPYEMDILLCPELIFGQRHFYRTPVSISNASEGIDASENIAGFFGNLFLQRQNTILDFGNELIYFRPNDNLYKPY